MIFFFYFTHYFMITSFDAFEILYAFGNIVENRAFAFFSKCLISHISNFYSLRAEILKWNLPVDDLDYSILVIYTYYTSREFPIQNFHRRTTDILWYHPLLQRRRILPRVCHSSGWYYKISGRSHDAQRRCAYGSFTSGDVQQQWRTWRMIWRL